MSSGPSPQVTAKAARESVAPAVDGPQQADSQRRSKRLGSLFGLACLLAAWFGVLVLAVLLIGTIVEAWGWLDWQFLSDTQRVNDPEGTGARPGIWGTLWLILLTGAFAIPVGVGAAIYIEEFASDNWLRRLVQVNLSNLAGVPSVVYGILGLTVFVRMFGWSGATIRSPLWPNAIELPFGRTVISGALTMSLLILPVIIVASQEALRAVPASIRHAALALGATKWQTIRTQVLPAAAPGIMTGVILAISRAIGETAPLVILGVATFIPRSPGGIESVSGLADLSAVAQAPFDNFTTLTLLIYGWIDETKADYAHVTAAGILVVLGVLLLLNTLAIVIRNRFQRYVKW